MGNNCPIDTDDPSEILQFKHFVHSCAAIGAVFGAFVGQFYEWFVISNRGKINQSIWIWWVTPMAPYLFRLLISAFVSSCLLLYESLIPATFINMTEGSINFILGTMVSFMLPYFLLTFAFFGLLRALFFRLKLDNPDSVGKEFMPKELILGRQPQQSNFEMEIFKDDP